MTEDEARKVAACKHCRNGFFCHNGGGHYFGQDVECVNGILIDIDEAHEGWQPDVAYPVAPCHPDWAKQCADADFCSTDADARLTEWADQSAILQEHAQ